MKHCLLAVCGMEESVLHGVINGGKLINLTSSGRHSALATWFRVIIDDTGGFIAETTISFKTRFQIKKYLASRSALSSVYKQERRTWALVWEPGRCERKVPTSHKCGPVTVHCGGSVAREEVKL